MSYSIIIKRQAKNKLQNLSRPERVRIVEKIEMLGHNPDCLTLDVKPLEGQPFYRLRVGNWRVIFDRNYEIKIIAIEKIKPRGDAYK